MGLAGLVQTKFSAFYFLSQILNLAFSASSGLPPTLSLINKPAYQKKYNYLKEKYGKDLVADWPEVTDPQKFVYEDVAIAAYLLVLWDGLGIKGTDLNLFIMRFYSKVQKTIFIFIFQNHILNRNIIR